MDLPQKPLLTLLTILATIAGIIGCVFAAPSFILSLRELWTEVSPSSATPQLSLTASPIALTLSPQASRTAPSTATPPPPTPTLSPTPTKVPSNIWRQGTIRVEAALTSVSSSSLRFSLKITNEGNNDFTARFRIEDWTLVDDMGKTYASDNNPGPQNTQIRANNASTYNLFFRGTLHQNAKRLTLQLPDLSGMPDVILSLPVGSDVASLKISASILSTSSSNVRLSFKLTNDGSSDFIARFRPEDFTLVDDTGKSYTSDNGTSFQVTQIASTASSSFTLFFKGALNPNAKKLTLQLAQLSGTPNIMVEIPVNQS